MLNTDRISGAVLLVFSLLIWHESGEYGKLAALFPRVVISIIIFLSLILIIKSFINPDRKYFFKDVKVRYIVFTILMTVGWISLIPFLGFVVTSVVFFSVMVIIFIENRTPQLIVKSVFMVVVVVFIFYFLFHKILLVPLPEGILI